MSKSYAVPTRKDTNFPFQIAKGMLEPVLPMMDTSYIL